MGRGKGKGSGKGKGKKNTTDTDIIIGGGGGGSGTSGNIQTPEQLHEAVVNDVVDSFEDILEETLAPPEPIGSMQAEPLPSLPSISNVGTISPTGSVNRQAVPGGFQPLPQTAGSRKKLYQLSQFHGGINKKSSPRDISDQEFQDAQNVTLSNVGAIKLLGDCLNDSTSSINDVNGAAVEFVALESGDIAKAPASGYGLFEFSAPADKDGAEGQYQIFLTSDGDQIDARDKDGDTENWIDLDATASDTDVCPVFYAAGNGVYVSDANFANGGTRKSKIYVSRSDAGSSQDVSGWKYGGALINSPIYDISAHGSMAAGDVKVVHTAETASVSGTMIVDCTPTGTGTWNGQYLFYVSWLFDGGCETGLTSCSTDDGTGTSDGIAFVAASTGQLDLNISLKHTPHASNNTELGGDKRIEGARIYFKPPGESERYLLAEASLIDGVKGATDTTYTPWAESSDVYSHATISFENPPAIYTYASLNGYYANEVYTPSLDDIASNTAGPTPLDLRYKTAVVGTGGIVYVGNVKFDGKHKPDSMMFSMPGKPGVFPKFNIFDSPSSDGSPITALASFQDTILQFKENSLFIINVSNPQQFYAEQVYRDCGVFNPCQVFTTSFGVIFANKHGCFLYNGQSVISLTAGKIGSENWGLKETSISEGGSQAGLTPSVGYCPRSQNIIVLKNIGDDASTAPPEDDAWVYNMSTQSWSEMASAIDNANERRHTNFIITSKGYLSLKDNNDQTLHHYEFDKSVDTGAQVISLLTKDIDFGLPSQTKKIFKIYVTYRGDASSVNVYWRKNGIANANGQFNSSNTPLSNAGSATSDDQEIATLTATTPSDLAGIYSLALEFTGSAGADFEINDISILYRVRPIK